MLTDKSFFMHYIALETIHGVNNCHTKLYKGRLVVGRKTQLSLGIVSKNGCHTQYQLIKMEDKATWRSPRTTKRKQFFDNGNVSGEKGKQFRACEKAGCPASKPTCCARLDET